MGRLLNNYIPNSQHCVTSKNRLSPHLLLFLLLGTHQNQQTWEELTALFLGQASLHRLTAVSEVCLEPFSALQWGTRSTRHADETSLGELRPLGDGKAVAHLAPTHSRAKYTAGDGWWGTQRWLLILSLRVSQSHWEYQPFTLPINVHGLGLCIQQKSHRTPTYPSFGRSRWGTALVFCCFSVGKRLRAHLAFCGMEPKKNVLDAMPFLLGARNKARAELIVRIKDGQVDAVLLPGRSNQTTLICLVHPQHLSEEEFQNP